MKRIFSIFLLVLLTFSLSISVVFAAELPSGITLPEVVDGDDYILFFNTYESDGNTYLKGTLLDNVTVADLKYSAGQYSSGQYFISVYLHAKRYDLYELDTQNGTAWNATLNKSASLRDNGYYEVSSVKFDDASYIYSFPYDIYFYDNVIYDASSSNESIPDYTEPTDPSDPTTPPDDSDSGNTGETEEDKKRWYDYILDGIKSFFTSLFEPIISFIDSFNEWREYTGSLEDLFGNLKDYTLEPIEQFLDTLNLNTIALLASMWELPIVKEILYCVVAIMCFGAVVIFLGGGI